MLCLRTTSLRSGPELPESAGTGRRANVAIHTGGCHCGRVRFKVQAPAELRVSECSCSICKMSAYLHLIVAREAFTLVSGDADLVNYEFNSRTAKHYFCRHCGIKSFYVPRSHPDGYSVNVRCLDPATIESCSVELFDGRNWESNIDSLRGDSV